MILDIEAVDDLGQLGVFNVKSFVTQRSGELFHEIWELLCWHVGLTVFVKV